MIQVVECDVQLSLGNVPSIPDSQRADELTVEELLEKAKILSPDIQGKLFSQVSVKSRLIASNP